MRGQRRWDGPEEKAAAFDRHGDVTFDDPPTAATPRHGGMEEEDDLLGAFGRGGDVVFDAAPLMQIPMDQDMDEEEPMQAALGAAGVVEVGTEVAVPMDQDMDEEEPMQAMFDQVVEQHAIDEAPAPTDLAPAFTAEVEAPQPADELFEA